MATRTLKLFFVGPHNVPRYGLIRDYIRRVAAIISVDGTLDVLVITPTQNLRADRFNDWIFGQIDTCDLLVADLTGFNPNVVYEVAFAHSLGVPCAYLRFDTADQASANDIQHYLKFSLIPNVTEAELASGRNNDLDRQLEGLFPGRPESVETILSDYYTGVPPVDSEFVRGLAEGYWRNFLKNVLRYDPDQEFAASQSDPNGPKSDYRKHSIRILIPDTFERPDADVKRAAERVFGRSSVKLSSNSMAREQSISNAETSGEPFFFDIPTTLLTITQSSKYMKVDRADYFDIYDRDRLTDRMARRFAASLLQLIRNNRDTVVWLLDRFEIIWLSEAVGPWTSDTALETADPIVRPDRL